MADFLEVSRRAVSKWRMGTNSPNAERRKQLEDLAAELDREAGTPIRKSRNGKTDGKKVGKTPISNTDFMPRPIDIYIKMIHASCFR